MRRRELSEQRKVNLIGSQVGRGFPIDAYFRAGQFSRYDLGQLSNLIVTILIAGIYDQYATALLW